MTGPAHLEVFSAGWPEVRPGADLCALLAASVTLQDGDVVVLTSKVVSKAEGRLVSGDRAEAIRTETHRVVARRGGTVIAQTRHGFVLAAAGVDASNTAPGTVVLLPEEPDTSARRLRADIHETLRRNVAVVISDTAGRAWRVGQTDMAIGCAGMQPMLDLRGTSDASGNLLEVTTPALADELAAAGDLVKGKASGCPVAVVRGLAHLVLPVGDYGPGAVALLRGAADDLFAMGAREAAAAAALRSEPSALDRFPALAPSDVVPFAEVASDHDLVSVAVDAGSGSGSSASWLVQIDVHAGAEPREWLLAGQLLERTRALGAAFRLTGVPAAQPARTRPAWQTVDCTLWAGA